MSRVPEVRMILCRRNGYWYLAQRVMPHVVGVGLVVDGGMSSEPGFVPAGNCRSKRMSAPYLDNITFFPEIRYRDMPVYAEHWEHGAVVPSIRCTLGMARDPANEAYKTLATDGWMDVGSRELPWKVIPLEELEMIEGPVPEGTF